MGIFGTGAPRRSQSADAVITGAGSGIGAAFAVELAHRGGRIVCSDIDEGAARKTAEQIVASDGQAMALRCDVSQVDQVYHLADQAQSWFEGSPTLVINNAGVAAGGAFIGDTELTDWTMVLNINLWGPIHGCHVFAPILREAGRPAGIINVASAAAFGAAPGMAAYNVSKAGTLSLSETLAAELAGTGVNVTVLCPTFVKTRIVENAAACGAMSQQSTQIADHLMRWTGFSAERVARMCLDTLDRGGLYCMPQLEARIGWGVKRFTPTVYTRAVGITTRVIR